MTRPSEILAQLLSDHGEIRGVIAEARLSAERCARSEDQRSSLRSWIASVTDKVRDHNRREEHLIKEVLPQLGNWDEVRAQFMTLEHEREHRELYEALEKLQAPEDPKIAGDAALAILERMLTHMEHEEQLFVRPEVLRDLGPSPHG